MNQHELCFETLANDLRLKILKLLHEKPLNVNQIATATNAERSRVSHALQMLRTCHMVCTKKKGREILYEINADSPIVKPQTGTLFTLIEEHAHSQCTTCSKHGKNPKFKAA